MSALRKKKEKKVKSEKLRPVKQEVVKLEKLNLPLLKEEVMWEDAYPFLFQTLKTKDGESIEVKKYFEASSPDFVSFLIKVVRSENSPTFLKNNFKKIRKFIEKEIQAREKLFLALSREQVAAFKAFFKEEAYFDKSIDNEYFDNEIEMVYVDFLKSYLDTALYESRARSQTRKRNAIIQKFS